ncbi:hypothetical protein TNCT_733711 [Trichonephila clavata]|uniref:Reverse transcriptase domain-containing protein n=1 Tax=Trichonephila clavata TaxID=2740835 RepID=A0A8X6GAT4_TRICU|nr:hypothetical protein TNCT_733711 [Trichonephila clavata]
MFCFSSNIVNWSNSSSSSLAQLTRDGPGFQNNFPNSSLCRKFLTLVVLKSVGRPLVLQRTVRYDRIRNKNDSNVEKRGNSIRRNPRLGKPPAPLFNKYRHIPEKNIVTCFGYLESSKYPTCTQVKKELQVNNLNPYTWLTDPKRPTSIIVTVICGVNVRVCADTAATRSITDAAEVRLLDVSVSSNGIDRRVSVDEAANLSIVERNKRVSVDKETAYNKQYSTEDQLFYFCQSVINSFQKRLPEKTTAVFLDMSSVFDRVWRQKLITLVHQHGIRGNALIWIHDFLRNRKVRGLYNGCLSKIRKSLQVFLRDQYGAPSFSALSM